VLRTRVIASPDWAQELEGTWKELVNASPSATPFQTWEWQTAWWRQYAKRRKPYILALYEGHDMVGLMPMMVSRGAWRALRAMASGASDYLHPLARAGYEDAVAYSLAQHLREMDDVDLVDLHQIRETQPFVGSFSEERYALVESESEPRFAEKSESKLSHSKRIQATCLVLDLPKTFDEYLSTLSKSLRFDVRKLDKDLFTTGKARIHQATEDTLQQGLDIFFETHRKRWRKRGLPGAFVGSRSERFHREWAQSALRNGWLWLSVLTVEDKPIGTLYAMRLANTTYYYQAGFDPEAASISPGTLLVGHTIRRAISEGVKTFDFLRGDEPYKRRWKPQREYHNLRLIAPTKGLLGKVGQAWNDMGSKLEVRVRARLEGRGLL